MQQKLLMIAEVAERLRVRIRTVRRWVNLRKIEYVKAGRSVRIPEEEINRIVREGTVCREKELCPEWLRHLDTTRTASERGAILEALVARRGEWIPSYALANIALQYSARVKELRDAGFNIENTSRAAGRKVHGSFRLVTCPGEEVRQ